MLSNTEQTHKQRRWLGSLRAQFWVMVGFILCVVAVVAVFVLWSLSTVVTAFVGGVETASDEALPLARIETDMRSAQAAGWHLGLSIDGEATEAARIDFVAATTLVTEDLASAGTTIPLHNTSQVTALDRANQSWKAAMANLDELVVVDLGHPTNANMIGSLQGFSEQVDIAVAQLAIAQDAAITELENGLIIANKTRRLTTFIILVALIGGAMVIGVLSELFFAHIIRGIDQLKLGARALALGEFEHRAELHSPAELAEVAETFNSMADHVERGRRELEHQALHDELTGLSNRTLLADRMEHAALTREVTGRTDALVILDLDHFKDINDTAGHPAGDRALIETARRIKACVRPGDTVARLGGDEFAILLSGVDSIADAEAISDRMVRAVSEAHQLPGVAMNLRTSAGLVIATEGESVTDLLANADVAMYAAKAAGGNRWARFREEHRRMLIDRVELKTELESALQANDLTLVYQPIYDIGTDRIVSVEALSRWHHPIRGEISPTKFIPIAEDHGLISTLGWGTMAKACSQLAQWQSSHPGLDGFTVAVNVAGAQVDEPDFVEHVDQVIRDAGVAHSDLVVEITETMLIRHGSQARSKLRRLRELGASVAIDDFGTGYSSLGMLRDYPADYLKIDREFIAQIGRDTSNTALTLMILELGRALGIVCVAEGVETESELETLRSLGCDRVQGFLLHRPAPAEHISDLLASGRSLARHR